MKIRLQREEVPEPPADAPRRYGDPPYQNGGYFIDDGRSRWRYDDKGLKLYLEWLCEEDRRKVVSFAAFWEREDYGAVTLKAALNVTTKKADKHGKSNYEP